MRRTFQLHFPEGLELEHVLTVTRSLSTRRRIGLWRVADAVVLEVVAFGDGWGGAVGAGGDGKTVQWRLSCESHEQALVLGALRSSIPSIQVEELSVDETPSPVGVPGEEEANGSDRSSNSARLIVRAYELRLNTSRRVLNANNPEQVAAGLLGALSQVRRGESIVLQWLVGPWLGRGVVQVPAAAKSSDSGFLGELFRLGGSGLAGDGFSQLVATHEQARALREKQAEPVYGVVGRIAIWGSSLGRVEHLRQRVIGALQLTRAPGVGLTRRWLPSWWVLSRMERLVQPAFGWPSVLNAKELACVLGWPIGSPALDGVSYSGHRQLAAPHSVLLGRSQSSTSARVTGQATGFGGRSSGGLLHLPVPSALHHLHVIGPTGVGKSTLLANLALADIAAGRPVVVIDPGAKGDLVGDIVERVTSSRADSVIVLDPADPCPVGLNLLTGDNPELVVDGVVHVFSELWRAYWGPRTADVLHHGLLTLAKVKGMTLCEIPPLLLDDAFRRRVLSQLGPDVLGVGPFWAWYNQLSSSERIAVTGPVLNKLRAFTQRPAIRGVIGQSQGIDLNQLFIGSSKSSPRTLLINLSPSTLGSETAQLLGALIMARLWQAIIARGRLPADARTPGFVYIDEFQQTLRLPMDLSDALVQARGLGVGLVLAHQHLGQLSSSVKSALLANAGSKIVFGLKGNDAAVMAKELGGGLTTVDLMNLPAFSTYQSLKPAEGRESRALTVSARTLPLGKSLGSAPEVLRRSRQQFGTDRNQVDEQIIARRRAKTKMEDGLVSSTKVGRRKRGGRS